MDDVSQRVHEAAGDAAQLVGSLFEGGATASARGVRMMATGLAKEWFNSANVSSPDADAGAIAEFYGSRALRYDVRVPAGMAWVHGERVVRLRLMCVARGGLRAVAGPSGVRIAAAAPQDLDEVLAVDHAAFESNVETAGPWLEGLVRIRDDAVTVACARRDGMVVATGYAIHANGASGRSVAIGGVGVAPAARRAGIGAAITSWLASCGFAVGAELAALAADDERAARLYSRLGFADAGGLDVYVTASGQPTAGPPQAGH